MTYINNFFTNKNQLTSYIAYPKCLFDTKLSETTKLIYIVLLDRAKMSLKNSSYTDSTGVFIYFPINKMAEAVNKSEMTVKNAYSALEKADLICRKHQGVGRPNKIYGKADFKEMKNNFTEKYYAPRIKKSLVLVKKVAFLYCSSA